MSNIPIGKANRGMSFENLLNHSNEYYRSRGIATIIKVPTEFIPIRNGGEIVHAKVTRKSICDYIGCYKGVPIAIEAKSTIGDSISKSAVKAHQSDFLHDWEESGGKAFVFLSYRLMDFVVVPFSFWDSLKNGGKKISDFPKEWKLSLGGRTPVDYIKVLEGILNGQS